MIYLPYRLDYSENRLPWAYSDGIAETFPTEAEARLFVQREWNDEFDSVDEWGIVAVIRETDGWFVDSDGRTVCHETGEEPCGYDEVDDIRAAVWTVKGKPA